MTTIAELVDTAPDPTDGLPITWTYDTGEWRGVFQIADPAQGASIAWHDLSPYLLGYNLTRGASTFAGRPEAHVANIEVMADHGALAPTNPDTSVLFGTHIDLGPGLLVRFSLIRVAGGVVVEWIPRFTLKVEDWGNASYARGQIRRHLIVARDTFTSLVDVPVPAVAEQDWSDKVVHVTDSAGWQYGLLAYHAFSLLLPARDEQDSAVRELDAALDPAGLVWFTDRYGHLYIRPRPGDTLHTAAGYSLPTLSFHYQADDTTTGLIAYAIDYDAAEPFGLSKSEIGIRNRVVITSPGGVFDQDDATSIERFDPKPYRATWIADNDQAAADILAYRAFAQMVAAPLYTCIGQPGFHDLLLGDYLSPAAIEHTASIYEEVTSAAGVVRRMEETAIFAGPILELAIRTTLDIESFSTVEGLILPVDDLALDTLGDTGAVFSWTNPTQVVTPTHTQVRMIGVTSIWLNYPYPITGLSWGGLAPNTSYQFQVRLVQITDGVVIAASSIRVLSFTTTWAQPIIDADGGGVTFPPPSCGSLDWELQESDDGTTWTMVDDGTLTSAPWTVDLSGYTFDPTKLYRVWQDACGDETYSNLFNGACSDPPALTGAPFDDADLVAYWPAICPPDRIVEAITESPAMHGPCFDTFVLDGDSNIVLVANGEGTVAYGFTPGATVAGDSDMSISTRVIVSTQPDDPVTLFGYEDLAIQAYAHGTKWAMRVVVIEDGAGTTTLSSGEELDFGAWYDLTVTHDVSAGDLIGYISNGTDTTVVFSALGTVAARTAGGTFLIGQSDNGLITNCAVWDRVLDATETPNYLASLTVTINKGATQADPVPDGAGPVVFDVVFSAAVTGFATGDVTLSGTAGATTATVVDSGDHIHFTVNVTGMTTTGTVIASIAAALCSSTVGGVPNDASTSTDNNVTWNSGYTDDFNRADGALGSNWTTINGSVAILGNRFNGSGNARWNTAISTNNAYAEVDVTGSSIVDNTGTGVHVNTNTGQTAGYLFQVRRFDSGSPARHYRIIRESTGIILTGSLVTFPTLPFRVRGEVEYSGGNALLRMYVNGSLVLSHTDTSPDTGNHYCGLNAGAGASATSLDNFKCGAL